MIGDCDPDLGGQTLTAVAPTQTSALPTPTLVENHSVGFATPLTDDKERLDGCYHGKPLRYHTM